MVYRFLVLLTFFSWSVSLLAQDSIVVYKNRNYHGSRPKIGLVLSGGGAKGIAHLGFLKVMEEAGIHPDYIAGTSMGSIVGALYSIGFSVDSIKNMMLRQDWDEILSNKIDFRRVNMEEKPDYGEYFVELPFHGWKPTLPSGAIKGQQLELLFERLTISVADDSSFDQFYIPYRAVATDLLTGRAYVFSKGPLALAMRSSMSIPSIMQPVKYKDMLLVDGGLVKNFPVDVVKDMGADIVIGVYTGGQLLPEEELNSMIVILKQSSFMGGILDAQRQRKNVDIYIEPSLNDMSAADFNSVAEFYDRGYKAAKSKYAALKDLADYMKQFDGKPKERPKLRDSIYVSEVEYSKLSNKRYERLAKKALYTKPGQKMTYTDIEENINRLYGTRLFKKVGYYFSKADSLEGAKLSYELIERESKHLNIGLQYRNETKIGLNLGMNFRNVILPMSKLDLKVRLSEYPALRLRYFTYFDYTTKFGTSISYNFYASDVPIYENHALLARYTRYLSNIKGDFSFFPGINSAFTLGLRYQMSNYKKSIDADNYLINNIKSTTWVTSFFYELNTLSSKYYPHRGMHVKLMGEFNLNNEEKYVINPDSVAVNPIYDDEYRFPLDPFLQISLDFASYTPLNKKWVISSEAFAVISSMSGAELINTYLVGGMFPSDPNQRAFYGISENALFMNNGFIYRLGARYELVKNLFFSLKANALFMADDLADLFDPDENYSYIGSSENYIFGVGTAVSYRSPIGPVSIGLTYGSLSSNLWSHISIGFVF